MFKSCVCDEGGGRGKSQAQHNLFDTQQITTGKTTCRSKLKPTLTSQEILTESLWTYGSSTELTIDVTDRPHQG